VRAAPVLAVACALLALGASQGRAQDAERGRALYETHCLSCHYERIHNRDPARSLVRTMSDLRAEVARWAGQTGRPFTLQDLDDIAEYLNRTHYRLSK
jgi:mono/diheme cytochrome c family protein